MTKTNCVPISSFPLSVHSLNMALDQPVGKNSLSDYNTTLDEEEYDLKTWRVQPPRSP